MRPSSLRLKGNALQQYRDGQAHTVACAASCLRSTYLDGLELATSLDGPCDRIRQAFRANLRLQPLSEKGLPRSRESRLKKRR